MQRRDQKKSMNRSEGVKMNIIVLSFAGGLILLGSIMRALVMKASNTLYATRLSDYSSGLGVFAFMAFVAGVLLP